MGKAAAKGVISRYISGHKTRTGYGGTSRRYNRRIPIAQARLLQKGAVQMKLVHQQDLTSSAGGLLAFRVNMINPERAIDGANVVQGWTSYDTLFNSYRVKAIRIRYIPYLFQEPVATTAFRPLGLTVRPNENDASNLATLNDVVNEDHYKLYDLRKPFTLYRKVWTPGVMTDASDAAVHISKGGWMQPTDPPVKGTPVAYFVAEGLSNSKTYGKVIVTYFLQFKDRKA